MDWLKCRSNLNAECGVSLAVISARRSFQCRSGGEVAVRSSFVEPAEQPVAHLGHVAVVVVHLGALVLEQELALLERGPDQTLRALTVFF